MTDFGAKEISKGEKGYFFQGVFAVVIRCWFLYMAQYCSCALPNLVWSVFTLNIQDKN